jgi:hypothetical protein
LTEIAVEKNSTIIFPLPIDLVEPLLGVLKSHANTASVNGHEESSVPPINGYEVPAASQPPRTE